MKINKKKIEKFCRKFIQDDSILYDKVNYIIKDSDDVFGLTLTQGWVVQETIVINDIINITKLENKESRECTMYVHVNAKNFKMFGEEILKLFENDSDKDVNSKGE